MHKRSTFARAPRPWMEPLEPRLLYSADLAPAALGAALSAPASSEERLMEMVDQGAATATAPAVAATAQRLELVIVAANVEQAQALLDQLTADPAREIHVAFLDAERDSLDQISALLAQSDQRYSAVHLVSHGRDGVIDFGNGVLDRATLEQRATDIAGWGEAFTADGDFLLYGCDVAAFASGRALVEDLAALTGADVAASDDATGAALEGGDWQLEFHRGAIADALPFGALALANFAGTLASTTVTTTLDLVDGNTGSIALLNLNRGADGAISLREAIEAANNDNPADVIILPAGTYHIGNELIVSKPLTIAGAGAASTILDGGGADRLFKISSTQASISGLTLRNGNASTGGAINVGSSSSLILSSAMLRDNQAHHGGGLYAAGHLTLDEVTIEGNSADRGGGMYIEDDDDVTLRNTTLSGNTASIEGGGMHVKKGTVTVESSTIASNSAPNTGGISQQADGEVILYNSILANNTGGNADNDPIISGGFNIDSDGTAELNGRGDLSGVNPNLAPLADNGGTVLTHALLAGSIAIDAGGNAGAPAFDARGALRNAIPDIGAYEATAGQSGKLYWADDAGHRIRRVNPDGSAAQTVVSGLGSPTGVAVDMANGKVYWTDDTTRRIQRANLDGSNVETLLSGLAGPQYLALDLANGKFYFADSGVLGNTVKRANLDGSGLQTIVAGLLTTPSGIALDVTNGKVYWTESAVLSKTIRRANLDGSSAQTVVSGLLGPVEIELDGAAGKLYWTDSTRIQRANLDGSGVQTLLSGLAGPKGLALDDDAGKMYWTTTSGALIQRANLDGSALATVLNVSTAPAGIAFATLPGADNQAPTGLVLSNAALDEHIDTSGGYSVGTLSTIDADFGEIFSYTIVGGADAARFSIGGDAADELIIDAGLLDFESQSSYEVTVRVIDGANTFDQAFTITIGNVNDAPLNVLPASQSTNEDSTLVFSSANGNAITVSDVDAGVGTLQITLAVDHGTLSLSGTAGLTFASGDGSADQSLIFSGSLAAINAALDGLVFTPGADYAGPVQLAIQSSDLGNSGSGGVKQDSDTVAITVAAINDAPLNQIPGVQSLDQDTSLVFTAANGNAIVLGDIDAGSNPVEVTLTATQGVVSLSGTAGLSFTAGDGSADASMSFSGTLTAINAALAGLQFTPGAGYTGAAAIQITTNDLGGSGSGGPQAALDTIVINIDNVNDAPVNSVPAAQHLNQDTTLVFSSAGGNALAIADNDAGGNTLQVNLTATQGLLSLNGTSGLVFTVGSGSADSSMSFSGTVAAINAALDGMQFTPDLGYTGSASIEIATDDLGNTGTGGPQSDTDVVTITVDNVNDPPVNTLPPAQSTNEDTPLVFSAANGNAITVSDVDAGTSPLEVSLTATQGLLSLSGTAGLAFSSGDGNADATMTFSGSAAAINAALDGLVFTPTADYAGAASLTVQTSDLGNSGSGGPQSDSGAIAIAINAVNDSPTLALPGAQVICEDDLLTFSNAAGNAISIADVDAGGALLQFTLSVDHGVLSLAATAGLTFSTGDGLADASMTFSGTASAINSALDGLLFTPTANYAGPAALDLQVSDQGNSGTGGVKLAANTVAIAIDAVDDAPTISSVADQSGVEDTILGPLVFLLSDVDTPLGALSVTATSNDPLRVPNANLSLSGSGANRTLTITPAANTFGGPAVITVTVGDASTAVETCFQVSFAAVNDSPVAAADGYATDSNRAVRIMAAGMLANDADADPGDLVHITVVNGGPATPGNSISLASGARLEVNADGSFTYDPAGAFANLGPGIQATDSFEYAVSDGNGGSSTATVVIEVTGVATAPPPPPPPPPPPADDEVAVTVMSDSFLAEDAEQWREGASALEPPAPVAAPEAAAPEAAASTSATPAVEASAAPVTDTPAPTALEADSPQVTTAGEDQTRSGSFQERSQGPPPAARAVSVGAPASALTVPTAVTAPPAVAPVFEAHSNEVAEAVKSAEFLRGIDGLRQQVEASSRLDQAVVGSSLVASSGLSIGYIVWLLRGGVLLSTALSSLPAWRMVDPLPVLARLDDDGEETNGESLQSMLAEADARDADAATTDANARHEPVNAGPEHDAHP